MDNVNVRESNRTAFSMLILFLMASMVTAILGFTVFAHSQLLGIFILLSVVFVIMAIAMSFIT